MTLRHGSVLVLPMALMALVAAGCAGTAGGMDGAGRRARLEAFRHTAASEIYAACKDSVVNIGVTRKDAADPKTTHTEFGSGMVLAESGYVLTSAHIFRRGGNCAVGFTGGPEYPAHVVAKDDGRDIAVLKIDAKPGPGGPARFKPVRLGRSSDLIVGERIVTMGSPFGMGLTVTQGNVSALGRTTNSDFTKFPDMIQTAASNNPGGSGGPLLNVFGEVVGINATWQTGANDIGFAIPIDRVRAAMPEILDPEGRLSFVLGMRVSTDGPAAVTAVAAGSPAEAAGVRAGDVVAAVGPVAVTNGVEFYLALMDCRAGQALPLRLVREGKTIDMIVTLAKGEPRAAEDKKRPAPAKP
jgi:S1-C subfamily serine protease